MSPDHWQRVRELFLRAIELAPAERDGFLQRESAGDEELLLEARRLLGAREQTADDFLQPPELEHLAEPLRALTGAPEGMTIGGYRLQGELGRGGMGVVYAAEAAGGGRVAIKVLSPHLHLSPEAVERFKREARAASRLDHPNIVPVLDFGKQGQHYFFAMELVDGPALSALVEARRARQPLRPELASGLDIADPRLCAELVALVADALEHAHRNGVIHRDVKPQNVLLDPSGSPRLVDFGLARDVEASTLTRTGEVAGTPHYMSPEQALSQLHRIDHRTDIYSLGAVLYELLTLRRPFEGATQQEIFYNIAHRHPPAIERIAPNVPRQLALVCMKALRREPERRYASAAEMAADLRRYLGGEEVLARPPSLVYRARQLARQPRNLVRALPLVLALGLMGGYVWRQQRLDAAEMAARPTVNLTLSSSGAEAAVSARARTRPLAAWGPPEELGSTSAGALSLRLEPGAWMLVLADGQGRFAELARDLERAEVREERPRLASVDEVRAGMVRVEGGSFELPIGLDPEVRAGVELRTFWIDRACVTNGEYAEFLAATGREEPPRWPADTSPGSADLPRPDWLALPVTSVRIDDARAYAEWAGKRLPTAWELLAACGASDPGWLTEALAEDLMPLVIGGDQYALTEQGEESPYLGYLAAVRPAGGQGERALGPYGLYHPVGNVLQISETPGWFFGTDPPAPDPGSLMLVGYPWHVPVVNVRKYGLAPSVKAERHGRARDWGFRCAKSAVP